MISIPVVVLLWGATGAAVGALGGILTPRMLTRETCPGRRQLLAGSAAATAIALALLAARFGGIELLAFSAVAAVGVAASAVDLIERRLPGRLLLPGCALLAGLLALEAVRTNSPASFTRAVGAAVAVAGTYLVIALASHGGLGAGDVKLGGLLGMALGWQGWTVVLAGTFLAWAAAAIALLLDRRLTGMPCLHTGVPGATIPMGPFLLGGAVLALSLG